MATTSRRSLHALLGGGAGTHAHSRRSPIRVENLGSVFSSLVFSRLAVADLVLWRRRNVSAAAVAGATAVWFLFERAGYSFPSVMANALLLLVAILFFWAKSASLLNRWVFALALQHRVFLISCRVAPRPAALIRCSCNCGVHCNVYEVLLNNVDFLFPNRLVVASFWLQEAHCQTVSYTNLLSIFELRVAVRN